MIKALANWLDDRTGYRELVRASLYEHIPGGARYRYVWGSTLVFAFSVQLITGLFLWMSYSPSGQTAWESVYYIQHEMQGGWLLRGLHHFMAQAMVVLLALHLLQVVIDGAYRAPREVNFWLGLILMQIVLGLSLTGYLLPWDQKGYWATRVATNLMGIVPVVGPSVQKLVVGGVDYGHHTLTRFFALHAGVLPALLVGFLVLHVAMFRKHGIHAAKHDRPDATFWPDQVLKDAVACLAVLAVVLFFAIRPALSGSHGEAPLGDYLGAELGAPADPSNEYSAARPEWYFLFLFQFLKLFEGLGEQGELVGAIVVPGAVMGLLALMPIVGRWKLGHRFNIGLLVCLLIGVGILTGQALYADRLAQYAAKPEAKTTAEGGESKTGEEAAGEEQPETPEALFAKRYEASQSYLKAVEAAEKEAHRAVVLARAPEGIPASGMLSVLRRDPKTQGPRLFKRYCSSCHADVADKPAEITAPDLTGFGSRKWIAGLLDPKEIVGMHYFGGTKHANGEMADFVTGDLKDVPAADVQKVVAALSAEAALPSQRAIDEKDRATIEKGRALIKDSDSCARCHKFHDADNSGGAPDLTGYGSREWLTGMISNPNHEQYYGEHNDRMPAFAEHAEDVENNIISPANLALLVDWLRGEWYEPEGAATANAEPEDE
ncbi:MAG TPA: cytochrome b N-terminal domain-containing protein [Pirellulales bacterium]|nr:cytochrome b N-terminal domain-containing protein [Pirellulales bacterium]